ncbi:phosphodiester glycosidase family protein [Baekduia soli]|uniref:Phosphodiester glycosidase family protein n=1 Tax=Baekduia soli TaxID=496014 RepID=A0A5B8U795_9ACTN|nr:phosphodiester glycosidase family protein [Baekduia soli]QEC48999.1 phosphodiester glycosidase family protein [Baekduia soli]
MAPRARLNPLRPALAPRPRHLRRERLRLRDGARTTLYVARYDLRRTDVRVVRLARPAPLEAYCRDGGWNEAIGGGFYERPSLTPLGELVTGGVTRPHVPFAAPYGDLRACLHVAGGGVAIDRRDRLPADPVGDLLQAGPLLVHGGAPLAGDAEGFSAGSHQFDSDITAGRHPRAAIGLTRRGELLAVACDGRADDEAGLTMRELAEAMAALGATQAMNLDGGGSTSLVCAGRLRNVPREAHGIGLPGGRVVPTAIVFRPR